MDEPNCTKRELQLTFMSAARLRDRRAFFEAGGYAVLMLFYMTANGLSNISCSSVTS